MIETFINGRRYHVTSRLYDQMGTNKIVLSFTTPSNLFFDDTEYPIPTNTNELLLTLDGTVSPHVAKIEFYNGGGVLLETVNLFDTTLEFYPIGKIQFDGTFLLIRSTFPLNTNLAWEWMKQATWEYFSLTLYNLTCEKNVVTKTSYLTNSRLVNGQLEEETDITKPSVLLDTESWIIDVFKYNYAYIPLFKRYYFIDKIVSVRMNVYRIYLSVDVLYTYDSDIRLQDAFVLRSASNYDELLVDERMPFTDYFQIGLIDVNSVYPTPIANNCVNVTFSNKPTGNTYVLSAINPSYTNNDYVGTVTPPTNSGLPSVEYASSYKIRTLYAMDVADMTTLICALRNFSSFASYVNSIVMYPFNVSNICTTVNKYIKVNDKFLSSLDGGSWKDTSSGNQPVPAEEIEWCNMGYIIIADFDMSTSSFATSSETREPNAYYELWLPFYDWVKIDSNDLFSGRLIVYYTVDMDSGFANVNIKKYSEDKPFFSAPCQLGMKIPITASNTEELTAQKQNNALNLTLGLVGAGVSAGVGIVSGNPLALVGGVLSGSKAIASVVNANNMMFERAQTSSLSAETSMFIDVSKVMLRYKYREHPDNFDLTVFTALQGRISKTYMGLSSLSGYTEIGELHYTPSTLTYITKLEMDEIVSIARDGIIL